MPTVSAEAAPLIALVPVHVGRVAVLVAPDDALVAAVVAAGITILQLHAQGAGVKIPSQAMAALPYLVTIIALVIIMSRRGGQQMPAQRQGGNRLGPWPNAFGPAHQMR